MAEFWELPVDPRNVFANWFIGNTDPALDPDNRALKGKSWVQTTNDSEPWGLVIGLFFRNAANDAWLTMPTGPTGATGATGAAGTNGTNGVNGVNGTVIRQGSGAPSNGLGVDGDYYINTANGDLYQKVGGMYAVIENIIGPTGPIGPSGSVILFDSTLGADATTIDTGAAGIAAGYNILEIVLLMRTDEAVTQSVINLTFNNDGGANYTRSYSGVTGVSTPSIGSDTGVVAIQIVAPGASFSANTFGVWRFTVPSYTATVAYKCVDSSGGASDTTTSRNFTYNLSAIWRSTAAITRAAITPNVGGKKLLAGSRMIIYGR